MGKPNVILCFGDQWRAQAVGYAGDANVHTPNLDSLAAESINLRQAVAGCPVCTPYRASLLTGQHPLTHGAFVNDVCLSNRATSLAQAFAAGGYDTAYVGKWHVDGHGRGKYIPRERRQGFDYWKGNECTHDYNHSRYYAFDSDEPLYWKGYDAVAQTRDAQAYIRQHDRTRPFLLVLSWGPPHAPYGTAPAQYQAMYDPAGVELRPNVPPECQQAAREWLAGYYAHCTALDACVGDLVGTIRQVGIEEDTILVFTSDHGDMLGSQGQQKKQRPWEESIRVPFLLRYPGLAGWQPRELDAPIDAPDIMPTLLGLCGLPIPGSVEGLDYSGHIGGGPSPSDGTVVITCPQPFGQFTPMRHGAAEYRGLRTPRYTYARRLTGPWLLYDNGADPYQMRNLVGDPAHSGLQKQLDAELQVRLDAMGDAFLPGLEYIRQWGYEVDETGTVPYVWE